MSIRKACAAIGLSRSAWYRPLVDWLDRDQPVAEVLGALAEDKPGLGFWKLFRRLRRMGHNWNHKKVYRVYCLLKLNLQRRSKKRVPPRDPMPLLMPDQPNQVSDQVATNSNHESTLTQLAAQSPAGYILLLNSLDHRLRIVLDNLE